MIELDMNNRKITLEVSDEELVVSTRFESVLVSPKDVACDQRNQAKIFMSRITHRVRLTDAPEAYKKFRDKKDGCIKVVLKP